MDLITFKITEKENENKSEYNSAKSRDFRSFLRKLRYVKLRRISFRPKIYKFEWKRPSELKFAMISGFQEQEVRLIESCALWELGF